MEEENSREKSKKHKEVAVPEIVEGVHIEKKKKKNKNKNNNNSSDTIEVSEDVAMNEKSNNDNNANDNNSDNDSEVKKKSEEHKKSEVVSHYNDNNGSNNNDHNGSEVKKKKKKKKNKSSQASSSVETEKTKNNEEEVLKIKKEKKEKRKHEEEQQITIKNNNNKSNTSDNDEYKETTTKKLKKSSEIVVLEKNENKTLVISNSNNKNNNNSDNIKSITTKSESQSKEIELKIQRPTKKKELMSIHLQNRMIEYRLKPDILNPSKFLPVSMKDIQHFILRVCFPNETSTQWIRLTGSTTFQKIVCIMIPCLGESLFHNFSDSMPALKRIFDLPVPTTSTVDASTSQNPLIEFLSVGFDRKTKLPESEKSNESNLMLLEKLPQLILSYKDLDIHGFPLPQKIYNVIHTQASAIDPNAAIDPVTHSVFEGKWVQTKCREITDISRRVIAIDCEMVITQNNLSELARISLVDLNGETILDEYVLPEHPVENYLTQYSGITKDKLKNVTTTLADIQKKLLKIISSETILVGHSLINDLKACRLIHLKVIDTAVLFIVDHVYQSLKSLAKENLKLSIQEGSHDSVVDALIALKLVKLKANSLPNSFSNSPRYITLGGHSTPVNNVQFKYGYNLFELFSRSGKSCTIIDNPTEFQKYGLWSTKFIPTNSSTETLDKILQNLKEDSFFTFSQFHDLNEKSSEKPENIDRILSELNVRIEAIYNSLPAYTLFIVFSGSGQISKFSKKTPQQIVTEGLVDVVAEAKRGVAFFDLRN